MKTKKKEISIIIPCYNVEKYIEKCLDSLTIQLKNYNYEIILINDCSKDNTDKIIKKYISTGKENIIYINNENNIGAGASRNKAVKIAKYDLISFIDADDYVDDNFYDVMISELLKNKADVIACDIEVVYENDNTSMLSKACFFVPSKFNLINTGLGASPCNKIFKKKYLLKYPFAEGIMNEDVACVLSIIANCNKVYYTDKTKYYYIQHEGSVQNSRLSNKRLDIIKACKIFFDRIDGNEETYDFVTSVVFQQIICMILFIPINEKNIFRRGRFLRKVHKNTKDIDMLGNYLFNDFLNHQSQKSRLYYKTIIKLVSKGFGFTASLVMSSYKIYKYFKSPKCVIKENINMNDLIKAAKKNQKYKANKSVSVVIPNYNYERFLFQRIYSILNQKYKINELIILDDCSSDNSRETIDKIVRELSGYLTIRKDYNKVNSGSTFKQWKKSFELSNSDYVWIAEADDYCENNMLSSLMNTINKDNEISIAYVDTAFIDKDGRLILKTIKGEIDLLKTGHWNSNFINDGIEEIKNYEYLNCTIANVSSVLFKNDDYSEIFNEMSNYKQVGDYLFYIYVMSKGKISFINKPINYYRVHGNNVTSTTKKQLHLDELKKVHKYIRDNFGLDENQESRILDRYDFLERVWNLRKSDDYIQGYEDAMNTLKNEIEKCLKKYNIDKEIINEILNIK